MKMTPAEQHIAEQAERRDMTSICQRLARLEDRVAAHEAAARLERRRFNAMGPGPSVQDIVKQEIDGPVRNLAANIEALKESLEGAWERIQALILRTDAKMLRDVGIPEDVIERLIREPGEAVAVPRGPASPFDFGAELRRTVDEADAGLRIDWDIVSSKREPEPAAPIPPVKNAARYLCETSDGQLLYLNHAGEWCGCPNFLQDRRHEAQEARNRRQSELLARAAADRLRGDAYYALYDALKADRALTGHVVPALSGLFIALGKPLRMGVDHAED